MPNLSHFHGLTKKKFASFQVTWLFSFPEKGCSSTDQFFLLCGSAMRSKISLLPGLIDSLLLVRPLLHFVILCFRMPFFRDPTD
jgi:hypothetical protein